MHELLKIVCY